MLLNEIIKKINYKYKIISTNSKNNISNIVLNSKQTNNSNIFVCIKGFKTDGHLYLKNSYENGCRDFIIENKESINPKWLFNSTIILVNDTRNILAVISNYLNNFPSKKIKMVGVTGTKGKTTTSTLIYLFLNSKKKVSLFSTVKNIIGGISFDPERTTMESNELNSFLKKSYLSGERISIVEVSSHAVTLKRIEGIEWDIGVFTSFSRDHLDLYKNMENYFNSKLDFFKSLNKSTKKNKIAFINMDDNKGKEVVLTIENNSVKIIKVGSKPEYDYFIKNYKTYDNKIFIRLINKSKEYLLETLMRGNFNVINISLAVAVSLELGIDIENIKDILSKYRGVEGRFEIIIEYPFTIIIDYAHTPLSLQNILEEARKLSMNNVYIVFGCTGERDIDKRSIMGEIAAKKSDFTFITNDDTYNEDPFKIAKDVENGFISSCKISGRDYLIILDRKKAIEKAIEKAKKGDVLVIAGMGHEKIQILQQGPVNYNDKETILDILKEKKII